MKERQHKYIPGDYLMVCDVCGFTYRSSEMKKRWDNAWVCKKDFEPQHPQEFVKGRADKVRVPVARPDTTTDCLRMVWLLRMRDDLRMVC